MISRIMLFMNKKSENNKQKVLLIVRDGWGYSPNTEYNAIAQARTPYTDYLEKTYPTTLLKASGEAVGLPEGYMGNSEVGHMTMGAGRALEQSLLRINRAIEDGRFFQNKELLSAMNYAKEHHSKLHIMGLLQKEGVHAHFNHLIALFEMAKKNGFNNDDVFLHIITDGRDAKEQNAINYLRDLEQEIERIGVGKIVSLAGRYYAMDRNTHWERIEKFYSVLCRGIRLPEFSSGSTPLPKTFLDPKKLLLEKYQDSEFSDEFLEPIAREDYQGLQEHDVLINFSFRKDREREISHVFCDTDFSHFTTCHSETYYCAMTEYYEGIPHVAFPDIQVQDILGKILEDHHKTQLRISETEKYAHVTFFFDGGEDYDFQGETKIIIPSPSVATYDQQPEMSSVEITERLIQEIQHEGQDFILCNFPNADMVGHTGNFEAIKKGVEAVDHALEKIIPIAQEYSYTVIVTGDHGNAEHKHGKESTSHTLNPVPCTIVSNEKIHIHENMSLENIAATVLALLNIPQPNEYKRPLF